MPVYDTLSRQHSCAVRIRVDSEDMYGQTSICDVSSGGGRGFAHLPAGGPAHRDSRRLAGLAEGKALNIPNRSASPFVDGARRCTRLSGADGEGLALVPNTNVSTGTIEIDLRGKDVPQGSFFGVAFHADDLRLYLLPPV
jgi:hypothetical protein